MSSDPLWQYREVEQIPDDTSEEQAAAESTESDITDLLARTHVGTRFPAYELPPELGTQAWISEPEEPAGIEELTLQFSAQQVQPSNSTSFFPTFSAPASNQQVPISETFPAETAEPQETRTTNQTSTSRTPRMEGGFRFSLGPHARTYSGLPQENLKNWIKTTHFLLRPFVNDWTPEQQVYAVYLLLRGNALEWYNGIMGTEDEPQSWPELANAMMQVFRTPQHMYQYEEQLDKIKQTNFANLEAYFAAFQAVARELDDMPDRHLVYKFAKGLTNIEARQAILNIPDCTLQKAYETASSRALGIRMANPNAGINRNNNDVVPMDLDAFVTQGRNNMAAQDRNDVICWNCNQPGHLARTCRRRRNRRPQQHQPQPQPQQQPHNQGRRHGQLRNIDAITDEEMQMILEYRRLRNNENNGNNGDANGQLQENYQGQ
jgi:hypothetical protein